MLGATIEDSVGRAAAARRRWDVIVIGAGPAGALTARRLALGGRSVLLVDRSRFPRDKVCGGCLSAKTLAAIAAAGVADSVARLGGQPLYCLELGGWGRAARLSLPRGRALSRRALDAALVERAIDAGVDLLTGQSAEIGSAEGDLRPVVLTSTDAGSVAVAKVVVDASGLGSRLLDRTPHRVVPGRTRIGCATTIDVDWPGDRPGTIAMAVDETGYVGVVRLEDDRLNVAAALDPAVVRRRGPGAAARRVLRSAGFRSIDGLAEARWRGTPRLGQRPHQLAAHRVFVVGDAGGYVEPFTGEGIGWAVRSAALLAPVVERAVDCWSDDLRAEWARTYRRERGRSQRACRALAWVLGRPLAARNLLSALERSPRLGSPFVNLLQGAGAEGGGLVWR